MSLHVIWNGKEVKNPVIKYSIAIGPIAVAATATALIVFVLLPLFGVMVSLAMGSAAIVAAAAIVGAVAAIFGAICVDAIAFTDELIAPRKRGRRQRR